MAALMLLSTVGYLQRQGGKYSSDLKVSLSVTSNPTSGTIKQPPFKEIKHSLYMSKLVNISCFLFLAFLLLFSHCLYDKISLLILASKHLLPT